MDWKPLLDQLMPAVVSGLGILIAALVAVIFSKVNEWIKHKITNEKTQAAVLQITASAEASVNELEATARKSMASGKLSSGDAAVLKSMAIDMVKAQVPKAIDAMVESGMENMKQFVGGKVEQAVAQVPTATPTPIVVVQAVDGGLESREAP